MELSAYLVLAILAGGMAIGFGLGLLRNRANGRRAHDLAARLETANKERELSREELNVARETLRRVEREHQAYRQQVSDHFGGASDQLRALTLQYRTLYEHLAQGASALCPEGFKGLEGGFEALAAQAGEDDAARAPSDAQTTPGSEERDETPSAARAGAQSAEPRSSAQSTRPRTAGGPATAASSAGSETGEANGARRS